MTPRAEALQMSDTPEELVFHIDEAIYQIVGFDLRSIQSMLVEGIDPDYFAITATTLLRWLGRERSRQHAAIQLRLSYLHALESALALTFASLQAPGAVPAWLRMYRVSDLDNLTAKICRGREIKRGWAQPISSWRDVAEVLLQSMPPISITSTGSEVTRGQVIVWYADALANMARDFLSQSTREEYNDLKHGFRVSRGGFRLAISTSDDASADDSVKPAELLAESEFGSTSATVEKIDGNSHLLRYAERSRNWDPILIANRLQLTSAWIACVKAALVARTRTRVEQVRWSYFADQAAYVAPWVESHGMKDMIWRIGEFRYENPPTRDDLKRRYLEQMEVALSSASRSSSGAVGQ